MSNFYTDFHGDWAVSFPISYKDFLLSTSSLAFVFVLFVNFFNYRFSYWIEVELQCSFTLISLMDNEVESLLCLLTICLSSFEKFVTIASYTCWLCCLISCCSVFWILCIVWLLILYQINSQQSYLPVLSTEISFSFLAHLLCRSFFGLPKPSLSIVGLISWLIGLLICLYLSVLFLLFTGAISKFHHSH